MDINKLFPYNQFNLKYKFINDSWIPTFSIFIKFTSPLTKGVQLWFGNKKSDVYLKHCSVFEVDLNLLLKLRIQNIIVFYLLSVYH